MARRHDQRSCSVGINVEALEPRNLMAARVGSTYMLVDAWTSKPLNAATSQIVKMSIKNANQVTLHASAHHVAGKIHPSHAGKAQPHAIAKPLAGQTPFVGSLSPAQVRRAYGLDQSPLTGAGQTIAIIDAYDNPTIARDLQTFSQRFGLPAANLLKAVPTSGKPKYDAGWAGEIALDVEWAHAIAPGATILLVEAKSASYTDLLSAVDYAVSMGAKQISMSWGGTEARTLTASYDSHFRVPGVTFTAAAGDSGKEVEHPAISPYVTAVGGTSLVVDAAGNRISETAWSGSGGGISAYTAIPNYQKTALGGTKRGVPDVAFNADPNTGVYVYDSSSGGGWWQVGGTSEGAPAWAGIMALVNQGRAIAKKTSLGTGTTFGTNQILYQLAGASATTSISTDFFDITVGSNGNVATQGYDGVTGLGSPTLKLVNDLVNA